MRTQKHLLITLAFAGLALPATAAASYSHSWGADQYPYTCNPIAAGTRCGDTAGTFYNPWLYVSYAAANSPAPDEVCAKAVTSAGNLRSTSSGSNAWNYCNYGVNSVAITLSASSPDSWAYGYHNDAGNTSRNGYGHATTS